MDVNDECKSDEQKKSRCKKEEERKIWTIEMENNNATRQLPPIVLLHGFAGFYHLNSMIY